MGSSQPQDRSLGEGTFLPQWMKGKLENRFDFSESTFSPPSTADDSFLYIRYPKTNRQETTLSNNTKEGFKSVSELFGNKPDAKVTTATNQIFVNQSGNNNIVNNNTNSGYTSESKIGAFNQHQPPCQPFITSAEKVQEPKLILANRFKPKAQAASNEFHDNSAECGKSIVSVASQMMSNKNGQSASSEQASNYRKTDQLTPKIGSKSLPATPIASPNATPDSSPKSRRRIYGNRFFSGAFVPDKERVQSGWLSSILGQSREHVVHAKIEEEEEQSLESLPSRTLSRKKSISSSNLAYFSQDEKQESKKPESKSLIAQVNLLQAKPSEIREMNFWTPTSM